MSALQGILLLDKWKGISSNDALQKVKRLFVEDKAMLRKLKVGHTGTLDPLATGMLILCFGATKFSQFLLNADKTYRVTARLGIQTTTGDAEGAVVSEWGGVLPVYSPVELEDFLCEFRGSITQIPSMYSALKYQGKPLYEWARQGIEVPRTPRKVLIHRLELVEQTPTHLTLDISCSKGTYVRTLIEDLGARMGVGAHVTELRRLSVGHFDASAMHSLETLEALDVAQRKALLLPISSIVADWQTVVLNELSAFYLRRGEPVQIPHAPSEGLVQLQHKNGCFLGVGRVLEDGRIASMCLV